MQELMAKLGGRSKREAVQRLRAGRGVNGPLPRKDRRDGKPLGGNLPQVLARGRVSAVEDGFEVVYEGDAVEYFHEGAPARGQPARPVVGLGASARAYAKVVVGGLVEQARQLGLSRRGS